MSAAQFGRTQRAGRSWADGAEWALGLGLTVFAVILHLRVLTHAGPLWRDEANTIAVASRPGFVGMLAALEHESFPILPFAGVRAWSGLGLGGGDFGLRLLGFCVGMGILGALWWNRRRTRGELPLVALALFALNPVVIRWGDSLRGYGLGALLVVLTFGSVYRMCASPSLWSFACATAAAILSVQSVYQNALLLAAMCAGGCAVAVRNRRWTVAAMSAAVGASAAASLIPYAAIIARAREHFVVITLNADFARIWSALREALGSPEKAGGAGTASGNFTLLVWLLALTLAIVGGVRSLAGRKTEATGVEANDNSNRDLALYGSTVAFAAPVLFFAFVYRLRFLTEPWYFIVLLATIAVASDAALCGLRLSAGWRTAKAALCAAVAVASTVTAFASFGERQTNIDLIAATVRNQAAPADLVVLNPWFYGISFGRYFDGATPWVQVPVLSDRTIHRFDLIKEQMTRDEPLQPLIDRMADTLRAGHRVWIVGALSAPPKGQPPRRLPPASDRNGWYSSPYLASWSQEVGFFLQAHGASGKRVPIQADGPVGKYEALSLIVVEGWKSGE